MHVRSRLAAALVAVLPLLTACPGDEEAPRDPLGTVVSTRSEVVGDDEGTRTVVTVEGPDGFQWDVRLPNDTACAVGTAYPDCAG